jgi:hypothetical protein
VDRFFRDLRLAMVFKPLQIAPRIVLPQPIRAAMSFAFAVSLSAYN